MDGIVAGYHDPGSPLATLGVADGNKRARALYVKCGFVSTGERFPLHSDPTRDIEIYARSL